MVLRHERGWFERDKLDGDHDLCLLWMAMVSDRGWGTNKYVFADQKFLAPAAAASIREARAARFNVAQAMADGAVEDEVQAEPVAAVSPAGWLRRLWRQS